MKNIWSMALSPSTATPNQRAIWLPASTVCVPITSSTSCDQVIFVDQAADLSLSSDAVLVEVDRLG